MSSKSMKHFARKSSSSNRHFIVAQRNRYPETGCNGAPSLSIKTDFHVNFTETFSDVTRVFSNGNRRTLLYGAARMIMI